ncbi:MAG TPA: flagellar export protein FliJ [Candidatus Krumholzibacteria bacterium]|nr:flagellar export protein FliJ [Candidatus Krumholzibacteria bacterium]
MAGFRFNLQKVLDHRARLVDLRARDLAAAESRAAAVARQIEGVQHEQDACAAAGDSGALDVGRMAARTAWIARLDRVIAGLEQERAAALAAVAAARAALQAAWRDREVLEKLKLRQQAEWQVAENRRETVRMDELGGQRRAAARTGASGSPA